MIAPTQPWFYDVLLLVLRWRRNFYRRLFHSLATRIAQRRCRELLERRRELLDFFFNMWGFAVGHLPPPLVDVDSSSDWESSSLSSDWEDWEDRDIPD